MTIRVFYFLKGNDVRNLRVGEMILCIETLHATNKVCNYCSHDHCESLPTTRIRFDSKFEAF